jgi:hypothetical protein
MLFRRLLYGSQLDDRSVETRFLTNLSPLLQHAMLSGFALANSTEAGIWPTRGHDRRFALVIKFRASSLCMTYFVKCTQDCTKPFSSLQAPNHNKQVAVARGCDGLSTGMPWRCLRHLSVRWHAHESSWWVHSPAADQHIR